MSLTSVLLLAAFAFMMFGALYAPMIGVIGYVLHYHVSPEQQWWGASLRAVRFSFALAAVSGLGVMIHYRTLQFGKPLLTGLEKLLLAFLLVVWLSVLVGGGRGGASGAPAGDAQGKGQLGAPAARDVDSPAVKIAKVAIFALILTHVVTTVARLRWLFWVFVIGGLYLGFQAYTAPSSRFVSGGRLEFLGGPDFRDSNGLAGHFAIFLPLIGVLLLRTKWVGKVLCLAAGALSVNGLVLTRSRGAFVAMAGGMVAAVLLAPKAYRRLIFVCIIVVGIGSFMLMDPGFLNRAGTISASAEQRDTSAQSRLDLWMASLKLLRDHPLGVGSGNFPSYIHGYLPQYPAKDAHNTYVLCYSELGIHGFAVLLAVVGTSAWTLWRLRRRLAGAKTRAEEDLLWFTFGGGVSLIILLLRWMTMSRLYSESTWWILLLPVCLERAWRNLQTDQASGPERLDEAGLDIPAPRARQRRAVGVGRAEEPADL